MFDGSPCLRVDGRRERGLGRENPIRVCLVEWLFGKQTECSALGWDRPTTGWGGDGVVESGGVAHRAPLTTPLQRTSRTSAHPAQDRTGTVRGTVSVPRGRCMPTESGSNHRRRWRLRRGTIPAPPPHPTRPTNLGRGPDSGDCGRGRNSVGSVIPAPNSGVLVLPKITSPASRKRRVTCACSATGSFDSDREPHEVGYPPDSPVRGP